MIRQQRPQYASVLDQVRCANIDALKVELARVESLGGEGLVLRQPGSQYEAGRSTTLLKVKTFHDAEGRVVEHLAGKGRQAITLRPMQARQPLAIAAIQTPGTPFRTPIPDRRTLAAK